LIAAAHLDEITRAILGLSLASAVNIESGHEEKPQQEEEVKRIPDLPRRAIPLHLVNICFRRDQSAQKNFKKNK
jgi:hypothetical protein